MPLMTMSFLLNESRLMLLQIILASFIDNPSNKFLQKYAAERLQMGLSKK